MALVSEEFPPFEFGGIARVCYDLAKSLSKKGIFVTVISGKSKKMATEKLNDSLEVIRLPCLDFPPRFIWFQLQNFRSLTRLLQGCDIVHAVNPQTSAICAYLSSKLRKPMVTSIHDVPLYILKMFASSPFSHWSFGDFVYNVLEYPVNHIVTKIGLRHSNHIISCSLTLLSEMKKAYGDFDPSRTSVVYNGIDPDNIERIGYNVTKTLGDSDPCIVFYGRLHWQKGLMYLLKAFTILRDDYPEVKLKIFGKGPLAPHVKKFVSGAGLKDNVYVHGHVPYRQLITEIKGATIVVLPSLYEGQPIAALEAMACGKPLVAFDFPYAREFIIHEHNGLLARACDVKDLCDKLALLLSDKNLRLTIAQNARRYVRRKHSWDLVVKEYLNVYEKVLGAAKSPASLA